MAIEDGTTVKVHYKGTLADGEVFDSSEDREPLEFTIGEKQVIPGFEDAVKGLDVGEKTTVTLDAANAYGEPRDDLVQEVPLDRLPDGVEEGMTLAVHVGPGQQIPAKVIKLGDENAKLDMNHPLAGKELTFELELVEVE